MSLREPHEPALLTSDEITFIRMSLAECSAVLKWITRNGGPQGQALLAQASRSAPGRNTPQHLAYDVSLAIDYLDFAPAWRTR